MMSRTVCLGGWLMGMLSPLLIEHVTTFIESNWPSSNMYNYTNTLA